MKNKLIKCTIILVIVAALVAALWRLNSFEKTEMVSMKGYSYEKAVVTEVVTESRIPAFESNDKKRRAQGRNL